MIALLLVLCSGSMRVACCAIVARGHRASFEQRGIQVRLLSSSARVRLLLGSAVERLLSSIAAERSLSSAQVLLLSSSAVEQSLSSAFLLVTHPLNPRYLTALLFNFSQNMYPGRVHVINDMRNLTRVDGPAVLVKTESMYPIYNGGTGIWEQNLYTGQGRSNTRESFAFAIAYNLASSPGQNITQEDGRYPPHCTTFLCKHARMEKMLNGWCVFVCVCACAGASFCRDRTSIGAARSMRSRSVQSEYAVFSCFC